MTEPEKVAILFVEGMIKVFLVNRSKNEAISLEKKTFQELQLKERQHVQEWICKNTEILGERLLIIQKEFSGFDHTNERLDLLALDENGDIVIIENKLDDTGRDVAWQALKYASYCSGLSKTDIRDLFQAYLTAQGSEENAESILNEFLGFEDFSETEINKGDQRIILLAAKFRMEVTSTVMWLLAHNIRVKCIKLTPYVLGDNVLLDTEQIIPIKDAEEYLIKVANKKQEELIENEQKQTRHTLRLRFWSKLLQSMNEKSDMVKNINPSKENWIACGSGYGGLGYSFVVTGRFARVDLWINKGTKEENKQFFDEIRSRKAEIESGFGSELDWQRLDEGKGSRIAHALYGVSFFNEEDWDRIIEFMTTNMIRLESVMRPILADLMRK